jgi:hypothetical protein
MLGIVLPPVAASTRQGGRAIPAANPTSTPNAAGTTNPSDATKVAAISAANPTGTPNAAGTTKVAAISAIDV